MGKAKYVDKNGDLVMMQLSKLGETEDRAFDIEFWQSQSDEAKFKAAWELVEFACEVKGINKDELRLQRSVESIERRES